MQDSKVRLLVTGAYGLVGSRIIELWDDWAEIVATNRDIAPFDLPRTSFIPCDITDREMVSQMLKSVKPHAVLHLAAYTDVDGAQYEDGNKNGSAWQINVEGTRHLVKAAQEFGAVIYFASTDFVFGDDGHEPHHEYSPKHPVNWYGATKAEAEDIVAAYQQSCIMRFAYPYRAQYSLKKDFIASMVANLKHNTLPSLFTDQYITPTFIDDLAPAVQTVILKKVTGVINLCGGSWHTPFEIGALLAQTLGIDGNLIKEGSLRSYEKENPGYAHRPLNGRTMSRRTASLGITMQKFPETITDLLRQEFSQ